MNIIGIDPGLSGGIAVIPFYDFKRTQVYSLADYTLSQLALLFQEFRVGGGVLHEQEKDTHCEVYLEEPQLPMLNTQNSNNFSIQAHKKLARSLGQLEGICIGAGYPPNLVSPRKWQGSLNCLTKGNKNISKNLAIKVFPFLSRTAKSGKYKGLPVSTITHAVADALLIALYGYLQYQNPSKLPYSISQNINTTKIVRKLLPLGQEIPEPTKVNKPLEVYCQSEYPGGTTSYILPRPKVPPTNSEGDRRTPISKETNHGRNQLPTVPNRHGPYRPNPRPKRPG